MASAKIVKMQLNRIKKECDFALLYEDMKGQFPIFELKSYEHFLSYLKNPNYYIINKEGEKLPYLNRFLVLIVGDLNNDIIKFEAKETDTTTIPGSLISKYREDEKKSDYILYNLGPTTNTSFIVFNLNSRKNKRSISFSISGCFNCRIFNFPRK